MRRKYINELADTDPSTRKVKILSVLKTQDETICLTGEAAGKLPKE